MNYQAPFKSQSAVFSMRDTFLFNSNSVAKYKFYNMVTKYMTHRYENVVQSKEYILYER